MQSVWSGDIAIRRKEGRELGGNSASGLPAAKKKKKKTFRAEMIEEKKQEHSYSLTWCQFATFFYL